MKRKSKSFFWVLLLIVSLLIPATLVLAHTNNYKPVESPHDPVIPSYDSFKIDPPVSGQYPSGNPLINVTFSKDGTNTVDWNVISSANIRVYYVYVKGGDVDHNKGYLYDYTSQNGATSDSGLHAMVKNGMNQGISHVRFYYGPAKPVEEPEKDTLNITKVLLDSEGNVISKEKDNTQFTINVTEGSNLFKAVNIQAGQTLGFDINSGSTYYVDEVQKDGYSLEGIEQNTIMQGTKRIINVIVTNRKLPTTGILNIQKKVVDENNKELSDIKTVFTVHVKGGDIDKDYQITTDKPLTIDGLALGKTYEITENNIPAGFTNKSIENPSVTLTAQNYKADVVVTNIMNSAPTEEKGVIRFQKKVVDENGNNLSGIQTQFKVHLSGGGIDKDIMLTPGVEYMETGLALDNTYRVTEDSIAEGYEKVSIVNSEITLSKSNKDITVVITNMKKTSTNNNGSTGDNGNGSNTGSTGSNGNSNSSNNVSNSNDSASTSGSASQQTASTANQATTDLPHTGGLIDSEIGAGIAGIMLIVVSLILRFKKRA